jgi:hypothetical protein
MTDIIIILSLLVWIIFGLISYLIYNCILIDNIKFKNNDKIFFMFMTGWGLISFIAVIINMLFNDFD